MNAHDRVHKTNFAEPWGVQHNPTTVPRALETWRRVNCRLTRANLKWWRLVLRPSQPPQPSASSPGLLASMISRSTVVAKLPRASLKLKTTPSG